MTADESNGTSQRVRKETILAAVLEQAPEPLRGRTYIQKLAFLVQETASVEAFFFEAGDYGPFTSDLSELVEYYVDAGYIVEREVEMDDGRVRYEYEAGGEITELYDGRPPTDVREAARLVYDRYPTDDLQALIKAIYSEYPRMARNSVI